MSFESGKTLTWKYHGQLFPISFHNTVTLSPPTPYLPPPYSKTITSLFCFPSSVQPPAYCGSRIDVLMQLLSVYVSIPSPKSTKPIRQLIQKNSVNPPKKRIRSTHSSPNLSARATITCQLPPCLALPSCLNSTLTLQLPRVSSTGSLNTSSGAPLWKAPSPCRSGRAKMARRQS